MKENNSINVLRGEIHRSLRVVNKVETYLSDFVDNRLSENPGTDEAMVVVQSLTNYYTCIETLFLRISQFFENGLEDDRWHQSLLDKMILEIPETRPAVISEETYRVLLEILKFRHFSRYYFELSYDWDKLRYLLKKFNEVKSRLTREINVFDGFLLDVLNAEE
jgi:hypothetical protein